MPQLPIELGGLMNILVYFSSARAQFQYILKHNFVSIICALLLYNFIVV